MTIEMLDEIAWRCLGPFALLFGAYGVYRLARWFIGPSPGDEGARVEPPEDWPRPGGYQPDTDDLDDDDPPAGLEPVPGLRSFRVESYEHGEVELSQDCHGCGAPMEVLYHSKYDEEVVWWCCKCGAVVKQGYTLDLETYHEWTPDAPSVTCKVCPDNSIPAFGGYQEGSLESGEPMILVHLNNLAGASRAEQDVDFAREFCQTVAHETFHAMEELVDQRFDEDAIHEMLRDAETPEAEPEHEGTNKMCPNCGGDGVVIRYKKAGVETVRVKQRCQSCCGRGVVNAGD